MSIELDHIFVLTAPNAPEAGELLRFGLSEGPPNQHPGQGTANRRFAFRNAMLELLWVSDENEARGEQTRRTQLWERWSGRSATASPFGVCFRPSDHPDGQPPFEGWDYRPSYLPDPLCLLLGTAPLEEPLWVYLSFLTRAERRSHCVAHPAGLEEITRLVLTSPVPFESSASRAAIDAHVLAVRTGPHHLLEIEFDSCRLQKSADFRPHLPLVFNF